MTQSQRIFIATAVFAVLWSSVSCRGSKSKNNRASSSPERSESTSPSRTSNHNQPDSISANPNFATNFVCSVPAQVVPDTPYAKLGGGSWGRWNQSGGKLDHGCNGGQDVIKLKEDGTVEITAEYGVLGGEQEAHYAYTQYTAFQYAGPSPAEKQLREQYADFCDKLAERFFGKRLSEKFRHRLLDESTYAPQGTANQYFEKISDGYVTFSANKNKSMHLLNVNFFPSESDYRDYKDS
jgi:hypothetical protein